MHHWRETTVIFARVRELRSRREQAALATVIRIERSAYRCPGAKLLIEPEGGRYGSVSGGCLEEDVRRVALEVLEHSRPRRLHYRTGVDDDPVWGLGLGCDGEVEIFVQPIDSLAAQVDPILERLEGVVPFVIETPLDELGSGKSQLSEAVPDSGSTIGTSQGQPVFREVLCPPPSLFVCGAADDAIPLVELASRVGFRVIVVDHRRAYLTGDRFPAAWRLLRLGPDDDLDLGPMLESFVVLKTHSLQRDLAWARRFAGTDTAYIGMLGPRSRRDQILALTPALSPERAFGPVGLDLGAEGCEQIAISVVAEMLAVRAGSRPDHLRAREDAIHAL